MAKKSPTGSLPPAVPLAITPTFRPWTHTSDDSYFYQLSLVVATATVSLPDERTSTFIQLAFSGCVLLLCRFSAVRSFFEGAVLAKPLPSLIVAPPLFSRGLWLLLP